MESAHRGFLRAPCTNPVAPTTLVHLRVVRGISHVSGCDWVRRGPGLDMDTGFLQASDKPGAVHWMTPVPHHRQQRAGVGAKLLPDWTRSMFCGARAGEPALMTTSGGAPGGLARPAPASCGIPKEVESDHDTAKPVELAGALPRPSGVPDAAPKTEIEGIEGIVASRKGPGDSVWSRGLLRRGSSGGRATAPR